MLHNTWLIHITWFPKNPFSLIFFLCVSTDESCRVSVAVPPSVRQVVLFSSGPWGERICVNAELDAERIPITIGKLTPYNK